jgi:hypothetical protein
MKRDFIDSQEKIALNLASESLGAFVDELGPTINKATVELN